LHQISEETPKKNDKREKKKWQIVGRIGVKKTLGRKRIGRTQKRG